MLSWLRSLTRRRPTRDELLNEGLGLAMDWGENWLAPINVRLGERHPYLSPAELEQVNAVCQGALRLGLETVHAQLHAGARSPSFEEFAPILLAHYLWVDQQTLPRLFQQGIYYAAKMGGH